MTRPRDNNEPARLEGIGIESLYKGHIRNMLNWQLNALADDWEQADVAGKREIGREMDDILEWLIPPSPLSDAEKVHKALQILTDKDMKDAAKVKTVERLIRSKGIRKGPDATVRRMAVDALEMYQQGKSWAQIARELRGCTHSDFHHQSCVATLWKAVRRLKNFLRQQEYPYELPRLNPPKIGRPRKNRRAAA